MIKTGSFVRFANDERAEVVDANTVPGVAGFGDPRGSDCAASKAISDDQVLCGSASYTEGAAVMQISAVNSAAAVPLGRIDHATSLSL